MVRSIGRAKTQIAAIKNPVVGRDEMEKASLQLEEITKATEEATHTIMTATDDVEQILKKVHAHTVEDPDVSPLIDEAGERLIAIIEACAFQDLTGQRVTQVVRTLRYIESRVLEMIDIWGLDAFKDVEIPDDEGEGAAAVDEDDELLNGPALGGQGLSQADIDALFD
jgi:chemotaxis protein CheZ